MKMHRFLCFVAFVPAVAVLVLIIFLLTGVVGILVAVSADQPPIEKDASAILNAHLGAVQNLIEAQTRLDKELAPLATSLGIDSQVHVTFRVECLPGYSSPQRIRIVAMDGDNTPIAECFAEVTNGAVPRVTVSAITTADQFRLREQITRAFDGSADAALSRLKKEFGTDVRIEEGGEVRQKIIGGDGKPIRSKSVIVIVSGKPVASVIATEGFAPDVRLLTGEPHPPCVPQK